MPDESTKGKTVYFLGAGASKASDFKLPLMKGFFRKEDLFSEEYRQLCEFVVKNFPPVLKKKVNIEEAKLDGIDSKDVNLEDVSLEDVITYLELSIDRFGSFGKRPDSELRDARKQFGQLVQERLSYQPKGNKFSSGKFERIFQRLTKQDTIITLNYDLIVKRTLEEMAKAEINADIAKSLLDKEHYIFHEAGVEDIASRRQGWLNGLYLKLHGSLDWYQCPHRDCPNYSMILTEDPYYKDDPKPCAVCGAESEIAIVPPTMNKSFDRWPKLGLVWRLAREELTAATKVVFIGVSFAPSDYYLRWLIKSSFLNPKSSKDSVVVVDTCPSVPKKIKEMVDVDIEPDYYSSIDTYISKEIERK